MAKKQKNGAVAEIEVPEGFSIKVGRERGEGWVKKEEGNVVHGSLLSRHTYENRGKKRAYYQVKLGKPCTAEVENPDFNDEDDESQPRITTVLPAGAVVNVDEIAKLEDLESYTKNGGAYDVFFAFGGKMEIAGGHTMWNIVGPFLKMTRKPEEIPY